mgnify:CR=1 FL=1
MILVSWILKKLNHLSSHFEEENEMFYEHQVYENLELILTLDKVFDFIIRFV